MGTYSDMNPATLRRSIVKADRLGLKPSITTSAYSGTGTPTAAAQLKASIRQDDDTIKDSFYSHHALAASDLVLSFNGTNSSIVTPITATSTSFTIGGWVKTDGTSNGLFVHKRAANGWQWWQRPTSSDKKQHFFNGVSTYDGYVDRTDNVWHHLVIQVVGTVVSFYHNGAFQGTRTIAAVGSNAQAIVIGKDNGATYGKFEARRLLYFAPEITGSQITDWYNGTIPAGALWDSNNLAGSTVNNVIVS